MKRRIGQARQNPRLPRVGEIILDDKAIQKILLPVTEQIPLPSDFDLTALRDDLNQAPGVFLAYTIMTSDKFARDTFEELKTIRDAAVRLDDLLNKNRETSWLQVKIGTFFEPKRASVFKFEETKIRTSFGEIVYAPIFSHDDMWDGPSYSEFTRSLSRLVYAANHSVDWTFSGSIVQKKGSNFDWFAGYHLASIFAHHFKRNPTIIRDPRPRGPYIDFVRGLLRERGIKQANGKTYASETIAKARSKYSESFV